VGLLRKIKWVAVDRAGKAQTDFQDAVIAEDITLAHLWKEPIMPTWISAVPQTVA
jgi:hypothetical protein